MTNLVAGEGQQSHEVPSEIGRVVTMRDSGHEGTEIYRTENGFRFVSLDTDRVRRADRCVLVKLPDDRDETETALAGERYGCDLESGLALVGLGTDDSAEQFGEVIWDSAFAERE